MHDYGTPLTLDYLEGIIRDAIRHNPRMSGFFGFDLAWEVTGKRHKLITRRRNGRVEIQRIRYVPRTPELGIDCDYYRGPIYMTNAPGL
ncbi:hypothetical protein [Hymenobacter latericus]|uniref:hypothetical protein n=1 Tax=Hymenobacter sp. YIM 151858-1 TaxID=2987688 RepID=UPI0022271774|nr:hypothetical protein [Hymenobacter sp. YIM 151858-1]UYZ60118.1 hypothetical protein OIS50_04780 [Hymenobacter sp. YIM 151858-1]